MYPKLNIINIKYVLVNNENKVFLVYRNLGA